MWTEPQLRYQLEEFSGALTDDLNTSKGLLNLEIVLGAKAMKKFDAQVRLNAVQAMDTVLGLDLFNLTREDLRIRPKSAEITEAEIEAELIRRKEAKIAKDYATSDAIRESLAAKGVEVMDGDPLGWEWKL